MARTRRDGHGDRCRRRDRCPRRPTLSRLASRPTLRCTTAVSPTWAGCRNCRGRSRSSRGTTPPSCAGDGQASGARHRRHGRDRYDGRTVNAPVLVQPGHAADAVTVHLGYGRARAGRVANGVGFNVYAIRTSSAPWIGSGARCCETTGDLVAARRHPGPPFDGRPGHGAEPGRSRTSRPTRNSRSTSASGADAPSLTLYNNEDHTYKATRGACSIDQSVCIGCSACVVACQAENNTPVSERIRCARPRDAVAADRPVFDGLRTTPASTTSRCSASTARTRRARWCVRWPRRRTARKV